MTELTNESLRRYAQAHAAVRVLVPVLDDENGGEDDAYPTLPRSQREAYQRLYEEALAVTEKKPGVRGPVSVDGECVGSGTLAWARLLAWRKSSHAITFRGETVLSPCWKEDREGARAARSALAALRRELGV